MDNLLTRNCKVSDECSFSDHKKINSQISFDVLIAQRNPKITDRRRLESLTTSMLPLPTKVSNIDNVDITNIKWTSTLLGLCRGSFPPTFPGKKSKPVQWSKAIKELRKTTRSYKKKSEQVKPCHGLGRLWSILESRLNAPRRLMDGFLWDDRRSQFLRGTVKEFQINWHHQNTKWHMDRL